jgi:hypothetical protein
MGMPCLPIKNAIYDVDAISMGTRRQEGGHRTGSCSKEIARGILIPAAVLSPGAPGNRPMRAGILPKLLLSPSVLLVLEWAHHVHDLPVVHDIDPDAVTTGLHRKLHASFALKTGASQ